MISKFTSNQKVSLLAIALLVASSQSLWAAEMPIAFKHTANKVAQNQVTGKVTAEDGPLASATVSVKGTSVSTSTDAKGTFAIRAKAGDILLVSSVGYKTKEVTVTGTTLSIQLESNNEALEEVVVVGFAKQKKVNLTGAVQAITSKDLQDRPVTNVSSAIQGKFSGVTITQNSGQPGKDNGTIRIRGLGTINNANPLVIVDGIESSMNNINPNDIESVSVLKDGPSAAIYGSKAANGVILITTKKGGSGKPQLNYTGYAGIQDPTRLPEYMNSYDHAVILNEALKNEGKTQRFSQQDLELFKNGSDPDGHPNTDWLGLLYKGSGFQQSHNLQVTGGTEDVQYMASGGYLGQKGVIKVASSDRYNLRTNVGAKVSSRLRFDLGLAYNYQRITEPVNPYTGDMAQIFRQVNRIPSFIPYKYSNGVYGRGSDGNPIAWMDLEAKDNMINKHTQVNFSGEFKIMDGLKIKQVVGFQPIDNMSSKFV
ncbi:MAG TPA: TonB-dependent receptor, partial [Sphingobacterium sp.]|nr:TonB-dependent receptor [Sphingobacterium sp.]